MAIAARMRFVFVWATLLLLVLGACSDMGAGFFVGQVPLPEGDLFLGCPKLDDTKGLPDLGNGATSEGGASHFSFSVSSVGEANLSVPIAVPPGRAGMEPAISVSYSSAGDEGYLGLGFSLSGFSSITRCPKNLADDGEIDPVRDDAGDALCMDGARLVEVAPNEFRTVPDTFAKIVASSNASGPQSFTVHAKSGLIYEYASDLSAKVFVNKNVIRTWLISKISDRHGNSIRFKYINDRDPLQFHTREFAPQRIDYTDHPDAPARRSVQFVYQALPAREVFARGMKLQRSLQLDKIQTYVGRTSGTKSPFENVRSRDQKHHMNSKGYGQAKLEDSSANAAAIRGQEQNLIDRNGGAKSQGGTSGNAINGINSNNPKRQFYLDEAKKEFGQ